MVKRGARNQRRRYTFVISMASGVVFAVKALRAPQPTPYLAGKTAADLLAGANFAVGGATALEPAVLESRGIVSVVPVSLSNETRWFKDTLQLLASTTNGKRLQATEISWFFYIKRKLL